MSKQAASILDFSHLVPAHHPTFFPAAYSCALGRLPGYKFSIDGADVISTSTGSRDSCISNCEANPNCKSFSYDTVNTRCHFHSIISVPVMDENFEYVVRRCPDQESVDGESYTLF